MLGFIIASLFLFLDEYSLLARFKNLIRNTRVPYLIPFTENYRSLKKNTLYYYHLNSLYTGELLKNKNFVEPKKFSR